jgi:hypothetical protein
MSRKAGELEGYRERERGRRVSRLEGNEVYGKKGNIRRQRDMKIN